MSRVPSEDVDEVQADWKKASLEEKKQMVWDVRKLLDDDGDGDDNDADAPKPKHADAPKPPPKSAPPPPKGGYKDDSKSEVRRRGGGAARPKCPGSRQPTRPPAAPEAHSFRAALWAREEEDPRRLDTEERAAAALWCLPQVADLPAFWPCRRQEPAGARGPRVRLRARARRRRLGRVL